MFQGPGFWLASSATGKPPALDFRQDRLRQLRAYLTPGQNEALTVYLKLYPEKIDEILNADNPEEFVEIVGDRGIMWINQCSAAGDREMFRGNEMSKSSVFPPIAVFLNGKVTTCLEELPLQERNWSTSFVASTKHFVKVMKEGGEPIYTGEEGMEITRYAMAAYLSAQENRDVCLDEITVEAEANGRFLIKTNFCNLGRADAENPPTLAPQPSGGAMLSALPGLIGKAGDQR
jgi:hypothetical protein